jgi:hypothetical protein
MTTLYELALLGTPSDEQVDELYAVVAQSTEPFGLRLGRKVAWYVRPDNFAPAPIKIQE